MNDSLKKKKSDCLLELALEEQLDQDEEMLKYKTPAEGGPTHPFSEEHNRRMKKIFQKARRAELRAKWRKKYRQIAAAAAVFVCISGVAVMQVEAFRLPVMNFFIQMKEKYSIYGGGQKHPYQLTKDYQEYEPQYIAEGFEIQEVYEDRCGFRVNYINEEQESYYLQFYKEKRSIGIDTENAESVEIEENGKEIFIVRKENDLKIMINAAEKQFVLAGVITEEEAVKVLSSIECLADFSISAVEE